MRTGWSPLPPDRVPTLTEVIAWPRSRAAPAPVVDLADPDLVAPMDASSAGASAAATVSAPAPAPMPTRKPAPERWPAEATHAVDDHGIDLTAAQPTPVLDLPAPPSAAFAPAPPLRLAEEQVIEGVLLQLQRQVDLMLEYRIREVLTPLLERAADGVVRDARAELASTLRDVVARAVSEELAKHRAG